jgi:hypothetical protein
MYRKILLYVFASALIFCSHGYGADDHIGAVFNPRTGDTTLDAALGDINLRTHGKTLDDFIANISATYNVPRVRIETLINIEKLTPGDIYMAAGVAKIMKCPFDKVIDEYKNNNGKGWGVVAHSLGVKPGSKEFHEIKKGGHKYLSDDRDKNKSRKQEQKLQDNKQKDRNYREKTKSGGKKH